MQGRPCSEKPGATAASSGCVPGGGESGGKKQRNHEQPKPDFDFDEKVSAATAERADKEYDSLKERYLKEIGGTYKDGQLTSVNLNTDDWRPLFPEYRGTNAPDVHEATGTLNARFLTEALQTMKGKGNNRFMVLAGGGGSGKGTAVGQYFDQMQYPVRLDRVTDSYEDHQTKIAAAVKEGYTPEYIFIDRNPTEAWRGVVFRALLSRKKGELARTVSLKVALKGNIEARKTALQILKSNPDYPTHVIDNNHELGKAVLIKDRNKAIAYLEGQIHDQEKLLADLTKETVERFKAGEIPEDIAIGLLGRNAIAGAQDKPKTKGRAATAKLRPPTMARRSSF
jgi:hypothetical protein